MSSSDKSSGSLVLDIFLKKRRSKWERDRALQSAVVENADKRLGVKYSAKFMNYTADDVRATNDKVEAAVYDRQWTRAVTLAIRGYKTSVKLGMDEFTSKGFWHWAEGIFRKALIETGGAT